MFRSALLFAGASVAGLFAQLDASLWEKSAWVIMCALGVTALVTVVRQKEKLTEDRDHKATEEIAWLRAANDNLHKEITVIRLDNARVLADNVRILAELERLKEHR